MAKSKRKMRIPVDAQIRGIKKALANKKTPPQFKAGMRKRLERLQRQ